MEARELAQLILTRAQGQGRFLVAIAGPPGAGKSTLAEQLCLEINKTAANASAVVPMDGFHFDNRLLREQGVLERKGAHNTFNARGFVHLIKRLRAGEDNVALPVFDRDLDMAIAGAALVSNEQHILLVEGNYLLINQGAWAELIDLWDLRILLNPGIATLEQRLIKRWLDQGMTQDAARKRAMSNDIPNAHFVLDHSVKPDIALI